MTAIVPVAWDCPTGCGDICEGIEDCYDCGETCTAVYDYGGPWGSAADVIFCLLPLAFLLFVTLKPNPWNSTASLPASAMLMFCVRTMYLGSNPLQTCAAIIQGLFESITPMSIAAGAIFLFESMESSGCLPFMMREMKLLSKGHPVAEVFLIGWAFAYMIEGASGFGTPAALGAPMLASLGHGKFESVICLLLMNTLATMFGAVGTPIWYGLGGIGLTDDNLITTGFNSAVIVGIIACIIVPLIASFLVPRAVALKNVLFMYLSILSCVGPSIALSTYTYEFPSILGGMIGCGVTMLLIRFNVGLRPVSDKEIGRELVEIASVSYIPERDGPYSGEQRHYIVDLGPEHQQSVTSSSQNGMAPAFGGKSAATASSAEAVPATSGSAVAGREDAKEELENGARGGDAEVGENKGAGVEKTFSQAVEDRLGPRPQGAAYFKAVALRTLPLWGTVLILILTRIPQIGIKDLLIKQSPAWKVPLQTFADFYLSASLVFQLKNILTVAGVNWKFETLYVPAILPFLVMSLVTLFIFRRELVTKPSAIARSVAVRMVNPAKALLGALVLVSLIRVGGDGSPAFILGNTLSNALKHGWIAFAPFIGALGSFFSGSTTVSNLTFGGVQKVAATNIGVSVEAMLALQVCGATMGNGVCINNIVSASAVIGLTHLSEGAFIKKTAPIVILFGVLSIVLDLAFFMRF